MNLSFLEVAINSILQFSPSDDDSDPIPPLQNPKSLLRVLEKLLTTTPASAKVGSGKSEGARWACGLIKNLAKSEENAALIGKTEIPKCVVENIRSSTTPPSRWTSNSLEDFSLFVILNLAQWTGAKKTLLEANTLSVIKPIMKENDLQGLKATMAGAFLDATWADFPENGAPASKYVSELMSNIVEKKGKDGQYAYGVFKLYTATKAFRDLCLAAKKSNVEANTKTLATPNAVALCFQVVSDLVLAATEEAEGGSKYVPDAMSAEYAIESIEAMLSAILMNSEPPRKSAQSDKAAIEISAMLTKYSEVPGTSQKAKSAALRSASEIKSDTGSAKPILEIGHDLWTQYRKREGQPMDQYMGDKGVEADESGPLDFLPCVSKNGDSSCAIL
jgi:hypothetical protein